MPWASGDMAPVARYLTVNISSPNTPGLRGLQDEGELRALLAAVEEVRTDKPIFLKVAPDLQPGDHERIVRAALDHHIDALDRRQHHRFAAAAFVASCKRGRRPFRAPAEASCARGAAKRSETRAAARSR